GSVNSQKHRADGAAPQLTNPGAEPVHGNRTEARLGPVAEVDLPVSAHQPRETPFVREECAGLRSVCRVQGLALSTSPGRRVLIDILKVSRRPFEHRPHHTRHMAGPIPPRRVALETV